MAVYSFAPWSTAAMLLPLLAQAYLLVGRQSALSQALRIAFGITACMLYVPVPFATDFVEPRERAVALNFAFAISGPYAAFRAVEWALATERAVFVGYGDDPPSRDEVPVGWARLSHAISLLCSMRGIGWRGGLRKEMWPPTPPPSAYVRSTISRIVRFHILGTLCAIPILEASASGSMQAVVARYVEPFPGFRAACDGLSAISLGVACYAALEHGCALLQLGVWLVVAVARVISLPAPLRAPSFVARAHPPLFPRAPWFAQSMATFWSACWHALFLQPFVAVGYRPGAALADAILPLRSTSRAAGVMAVFALSALMHELGLLAATRDLPGHANDSASRWTTTFFLSCGVAIVLEGLWRQSTGRSVRGWPGRIWTFGWLLAFGTPMATEWVERGLADHLAPVAQWRWQRWIVPLSWVLPDDVLTVP